MSMNPSCQVCGMEDAEVVHCTNCECALVATLRARIAELEEGNVRRQVALEARIAELEYECAAKEREIQRLHNIVCDSPACTATVIRRDDGSRVCSAGHAARWVNVDLLHKAEAKNTSLREALRQVLEYFECRSDKAVSVLGLSCPIPHGRIEPVSGKCSTKRKWPSLKGT